MNITVHFSEKEILEVLSSKAKTATLMRMQVKEARLKAYLGAEVTLTDGPEEKDDKGEAETSSGSDR